jgi:hypothetical protein
VPPIYVDTRVYSVLGDSVFNDPDYGLANITYCVSAIDIFNAITAKCANMNYVVNKMDFLLDYTQLVDYLEDLEFGTNITNILFASNSIFQAIQAPTRPNTQPHICTGPLHCNFHGTCNWKTGVAKCECDLGYFGTYCDFKQKELPSLREISKTILDDVYDYVTEKDITQFDIEIIGNVVRALLNHPDIVTDENYYTALALLEIASGADLYAHQPYDTNVTNIIFEAYANAQLKIAHSYKIRKAQKDNLLLGSGMNIFYFQGAYSLKSDQSQLKIENLDSAYFLSD